MSLGGSGIRDWLAQRITAVLLLIYAVTLVCFFCTHPEVNFETWKAFLSQPLLKVMTLLALASVCLHSWIGLWTVLTDYVHRAMMRHLLLMVILFGLAGYLVWGFQILYGVS